MANTKAGGIKLRETMIKKFGSEEAWKEVMRERAAKGGKVSSKLTGAGFSHKDADPRAAGRLGGRKSKRYAK